MNGHYYPVEPKTPGKRPEPGKKKKMTRTKTKWIAVIVLAVVLLAPAAVYVTDKILNPQMVKVLVEPVLDYDWLGPCGEGLLSAGKNGYYGLIDKHGDIVVPLIYSHIGDFNDGLAIAYKGRARGYCGPCGAIDKYGNIVIDFVYDGMGSFCDGLATVYSDGKMGVVNQNGEVVIPLIYGEIAGFRDGFAIARKDGKWGIIDNTGEVVVPFEYENIPPTYNTANEFSEIAEDADASGDWRFMAESQGNKWGLVNLKGEPILPFEYDYIDLNRIRDNLLCIEKDGFWGILEVKK